MKNTLGTFEQNQPSEDTSHQLQLLCFSASWCGPCQQLKPTIGALQQYYSDKLTIIPVDIDQSSELAQNHNIRSVPTLVFLNQQKETGRHSGTASLPQLARWLDHHIDDAT